MGDAEVVLACSAAGCCTGFNIKAESYPLGALVQYLCTYATYFHYEALYLIETIIWLQSSSLQSLIDSSEVCLQDETLGCTVLVFAEFTSLCLVDGKALSSSGMWW